MELRTEWTILQCPVCGRDDRYSHMKEGAGRHRTPQGMCPGTPVRITVVPSDSPPIVGGASTNP